ncbi:MAG: histidine kinase [Trueperaceae bacterium]
MREIPFWHRLGTRLALMILGIVAVLALATGILLVRGFELVLQDAMAAGGAEPDIGPVVRATVVNLLAIFLLTLVGAAAFSRSLLTDPIVELVRGTRELAAGRLGTTLPVDSRSELGRLAEDFNAMSAALAESREHLEQRVAERTADLRALLEISNTTAVTLELEPLLQSLLDRLHGIVGADGAVIAAAEPDGGAKILASRGDPPSLDLAQRALRGPVTLAPPGVRAYPLRVRGSLEGMLLLRVGEAGPDPHRDALVHAFANQAAIALENAQLYERVQEQAATVERRHLARELHDSVSQALYAILLGTHAAQRQLPGAPDAAAEALRYVESLAQAGLAEMRALIFELRPESLEEEGLVGVLQRQVEALEARHGLAAEIRLPSGEPDLSFATKKVLVRVAQEATHNVVKHARARSVSVALDRSESGWCLSVEDDGVGFDAVRGAGSPDEPGHLGLTSMRERLDAVGGVLKIRSQPGAGTRVVASVPS